MATRKRISSSNIESESLEAHVELCQIRYETLNTRLTSIEKKVEDIREGMVESRSSMIKVMVGSAGTIVAGLLSTIVVLLMKVH